MPPSRWAPDGRCNRTDRLKEIAVDFFSWTFLIWAVCLGGLSAVSLPMGSLAALRTTPRPQLISILAAFGSGALIAALSVELVAPTVLALHGEPGSGHHGDPASNFFALVIGAVMGGILFVVLDQLVNAHGGFLRKTATSIAYFRVAERERQKKIVEELSQWPFFKNVSTQHVNTLVSMIRPASFNDGDIMARQGQDPDALFFVMKGEVALTRDGSLIRGLGPGEALGIIPVLTRIPNPGTATARGPVTALALSKENFDRLRDVSPAFNQACLDLTGERMAVMRQFETARTRQTVQWMREAEQALKTGTQLPTAVQLRRARQEHGGAPMAIWLGILLDGIPESFVIGSGLWVHLQAKAALAGTLRFVDVIPFTLIAGLFLSNFPEALASSANMRLQGWRKGKIFWMWFSLMVITAVGAGFGYLLAGELNHTWLIFAEGLAAGAMLTMIAAAMIPEAVHMGHASAVGLSTLAGFLAAISFKLFE
jgi:CRP-like cAMP-binding protein